MLNILQVIFVNVVIGISTSNIDNAAHFGGLIIGALICLLYTSLIMLMDYRKILLENNTSSNIFYNFICSLFTFRYN